MLARCCHLKTQQSCSSAGLQPSSQPSPPAALAISFPLTLPATCLKPILLVHHLTWVPLQSISMQPLCLTDPLFSSRCAPYFVHPLALTACPLIPSLPSFTCPKTLQPPTSSLRSTLSGSNCCCCPCCMLICCALICLPALLLVCSRRLLTAGAAEALLLSLLVVFGTEKELLHFSIALFKSSAWELQDLMKGGEGGGIQWCWFVHLNRFFITCTLR